MPISNFFRSILATRHPGADTAAADSEAQIPIGSVPAASSTADTPPSGSDPISGEQTDSGEKAGTQTEPAPTASLPLSEIWHWAKSDQPLKGRLTIEDSAFQWNMRPGWRQGAGGTHEFDLSLWIVDPVAGIVPEALLIETVDAAPVRLQASVPREDALRALKVNPEIWPKARLCGFRGRITTTGDEIAISVVCDGESRPLTRLKEGTIMVLEGKRDWLFLTGDSNDSPAQFTRNFDANPAWSQGWQRQFDAINGLQTNQPQLKSVALLVVPSKEAIFPDLYPLPAAERGLIDAFLGEFGKEKSLFWPAQLLDEQREYAFDRAETHWTDFGARLTAEALLRRWRLPPPALGNDYRLEKGRGDLGDKLLPVVHALRPVAAWPNGAELIFDNFVVHHGSLRIWQNPKPAINETLVIFGGSSSDALVRYFSAIFARVVAAYSAGSPDPQLLDIEKPHRVILQTTQRFLTKPAPPATDCLSKATQKIAAGQVTHKSDYLEAVKRWTGNASVELYLNQTLVAHPGRNS